MCSDSQFCRFLRVLTVGMLAGSVCSCMSNAAPPPSRAASEMTAAAVACRARFLAEAPIEWRRLEVRTGKLQGTWHEVVTLDESTIRRLDCEYLVNSDARAAKWVSHRSPDNGSRAITGFTASYRYDAVAFSDGRKAALNDFSVDPKNLDINGQNTRALCAQNIDTLPVRGFVDGPDAAAYSFQSVTVDGRQLVRMDFRRHWTDSAQKSPGYILFDPNFHWAIRAWHQTTNWGFTAGEIQYNLDIKDIAFPRVIELRQHSAAGSEQVDRINFDAPRPCDAPATEFTLEFYGLKPPNL